jgi:hypothetical protein
MSLVQYLARFIIGVEITCAVGLLYKNTWRSAAVLSAIMLIVFTLFILLHPQLENCFCFGEHFEISVKSSLIKNGVMMAMLVAMAYTKPRRDIILPRVQLQLLTVLSVLSGFAYDPPCNIASALGNSGYALKPNSAIARTRYPALMRDLSFYGVDTTKKKIILAVSSQCKHCVQAAKRLTHFSNKYNVSEYLQLLILGKPESSEAFINKTNCAHLSHAQIDATHFMSLSEGKIPSHLILYKGQFYQISGDALSDNMVLKACKGN